LRLRGREPQRRGRARRLPRGARHDRGRSARRILRPLLLRGLFHRPRRHEARSHGVQAAGEETACGKEKEISRSHARVVQLPVNNRPETGETNERSFPTTAGLFPHAGTTRAELAARRRAVFGNSQLTMSNSPSRSRGVLPSTDTFSSQVIYSNCSRKADAASSRAIPISANRKGRERPSD